MARSPEQWLAGGPDGDGSPNQPFGPRRQRRRARLPDPAVLHSVDPTLPVEELNARAWQIRQRLWNSHPEFFRVPAVADGEVFANPAACLDVNTPGVLEAVLGDVFGEIHPQVNVIRPNAEGALTLWTLGQDHPELPGIFLADVGGHCMAAVPEALYWHRTALLPMPDFWPEWAGLGDAGFVADPASTAWQSGAPAEAIQATGPRPDHPAQVMGASLAPAALDGPALSGAAESPAAVTEAASQQRDTPSAPNEDPGRRTGRRPRGLTFTHAAEVMRLVGVPGLHANDRCYYVKFLAYLEAGPSVRPGGPPVSTSAAFNALPLADQRELLKAAMTEGLSRNTPQAINRAQQRPEGQRLGAAYARTRTRSQRPVPTHPSHTAELTRLDSVPGLHRNDRSCYSAFMAHLETAPEAGQGGPVISVLADFNALPMAEQNRFFDAIADDLDVNTRQAINRAQQRSEDRQLSSKRRKAPRRPAPADPRPLLPAAVRPGPEPIRPSPVARLQSTSLTWTPGWQPNKRRKQAASTRNRRRDASAQSPGGEVGQASSPLLYADPGAPPYLPATPAGGFDPVAEEEVDPGEETRE